MTTIASGLCMVMNVVSRTFLTIGGGVGAYDQVATAAGGLLPQNFFRQEQNWAWNRNATTGNYTSFNAFSPAHLGMNSTAAGSSIYIMPWNTPADQLTWSVTPRPTFQKPTYYTIVNKYSGLAAEVVSTMNGATIQGNPLVKDKPSQAWMFLCE